MTLDDALTDSDDDMDNAGIGDSQSDDGSFSSVISESEVETLLTEKLMQGFVLQPNCCPTCNTPLVKAMINMPIAANGDDANDTTPINGVPFCVSCKAHVMKTKEEIRIMTETNAIMGARGEVLLAMSEDEESDDDEFVPRIVPQPLSSVVFNEPADSHQASEKVPEPTSEPIAQPVLEPTNGQTRSISPSARHSPTQLIPEPTSPTSRLKEVEVEASDEYFQTQPTQEPIANQMFEGEGAQAFFSPVEPDTPLSPVTPSPAEYLQPDGTSLFPVHYPNVEYGILKFLRTLVH